ncbi:PaaI family thioesterase [Photobacterium sp. WH77]|uniref:PaaI family thioesterase n=1 Tax=unclassified Photobacterium TaxID=2628852 RepID=UPI001ED9CCDD|nr:MULTISPECIES: PaaI family thioesterase [unclassified Photobacterium]MCG2838637.1 PaaI family thioesterase [Photobacterium sp. WH77]MCG2846254.1 PaaI family thioesterase [Photobacterium sp. WH80]
MTYSAQSAPLSAYSQLLSEALINHNYQQFCGIEVVTQTPEYCKTRLTVTEQIDNLSQTLHGGVIYSMMDVTSMLATIATLEEGEYAITNNFSANIMSATKRGETVEFEARITRNGRNLLFSHCEAYKINASGARSLIATAQLSKFKRRQALTTTAEVAA